MTVEGNKSKPAAISSATPEPILPYGSIPRVEKINTDSGLAVNLKYRVCKNMRAVKRRRMRRILFFMVLPKFYSNSPYARWVLI